MFNKMARSSHAFDLEAEPEPLPSTQDDLDPGAIDVFSAQEGFEPLGDDDDDDNEDAGMERLVILMFLWKLVFFQNTHSCTIRMRSFEVCFIGVFSLMSMECFSRF